jgi:predicted ATPase/DNA-binding XRE family transcriptional regulator
MGSEGQSFARKLRHYREAAELSQEALAERAGMSTRGISDLERGLTRAPRLHTLSRLSEALGLDPTQRQDLLRASGRLSGTESVPEKPPPQAPAFGGLPAYLTPVLGREREEAALGAWLRRDDVHLVTLLGPGGVGKTRLAVHMAGLLADAFADGVAFAGLAPLRDPNLVLATIGQAVGIGESDASTLAASIVVALRRRQMLLVIDNCEHVLEAAPSVAEVLRHCPGVRVLATSRSRLRLQGEQTFLVHPLPVPTGKTLAEITRTWSGVSLFVDRARAVRPDFQLTDDNLPDVLAICRALDGLPLALELAAAGVAFLPIATLRDRLERHLPIAAQGPRDAPPRHRTVEATVAWSYDLLSDPERRLLRWLSVFRGGWTLDLAESVAGTPDVLDGLASLVEHSLVQPAEDDGGEPRFDMLVTVAAHAYAQLQASGESDAAHRSHARAVLRVVEEAEPHIVSPRRAPSLRRVDVELDNVRAALAWSVTPDGDPEIGGRIVGSLSWYWYLRAHLREGGSWAQQLLQRLGEGSESPGRARALFARGGVGIMFGDAEVARSTLPVSAALLRAQGDHFRLTHVLNLLGLAMVALGEPETALAMYDESIALARLSGDVWMEAYDLTNQGAAMTLLGDLTAAAQMHRASLTLFNRLDDAWGQAISLRAQAGLAAAQGDAATARALYEDSVPLFRDTADTRGLAQALLALGKVELRDGRVDQAQRILTESVDRWREVGIAAGVVRCLAGLASVAAARAEAERATQLYAATWSLAESLSVTFAELDQVERERALQQLRAQLGEAQFEAATRAGETLSLERAIRLALAT